MPLTSEEITYFNNGINAVLKKETSRNTAKSYVQESSSSEELIAHLNNFIKKDFIAAASSKGILTPASLISKSNSDLAKVQTFVGYSPPLTTDKTPAAEQPGTNILESVNLLSTDIGNINTQNNVRDAKLKNHDDSINSMSQDIKKMHSKNTDIDAKLSSQDNSINNIKNSMSSISIDIEGLRTQDKITDSELKELNKNINNVYKILDISNKADAAEIDSINTKADIALNALGTASYTIAGTPKVITSCKRINKVYELGDVIAQGSTSTLGIMKAFLDCADWATKRTIDHYFTTTEDASRCGPLIPSESVFSRCIGALDISIEEIME